MVSDSIRIAQTANSIFQEFYGRVLAHYAVCWLMQRAGDAYGIARQTLSFTGHVNLISRAQPHPGVFPQRGLDVESAGSLIYCVRQP